MKLSLVILSLAVSVLLGVVNAYGAGVPAGPPCTTDDSGNTVLNPQVLYLNPSLPFQPNVYYPKYKQPLSDPSIQITNPAIVSDINGAFSAAPPSFQQQLCHLDAIFVNPSGCSNFTSANNFCAGLTNEQIIENSWGYREQPSQFAPGAAPSHYGRYIAISAGAWSQSNTPTVKYSDFETALFQQLLNWPTSVIDPNSHQPKTAHPPKYDDQNTTPNTSTMSILAALAHEFGHVFWYDTFRPTPGGPYDFSTFCRAKFFENSWHDVDPPPIWRKFGEAQNTHKYYDVEISQLALSITRGNTIADFSEANALLRKIYRSEGHWASLFSAFSPDEDFVETFKFYVLTNASIPHNGTTSPLISLPLNFYDNSGNIVYTEDVAKDLQDPNKKLELKRKIACVGP